jgi:hypothetical protein
MLDQGCGGETRMVMAEMTDGGDENARHKAHDSGRGDAPWLA